MTPDVEYRLPETVPELFSLCSLVRQLHEDAHWSIAPYDAERAMILALRWAGRDGIARTSPDKAFLCCAIHDGLVLGASAATIVPAQLSPGLIAWSELIYVGKPWRRGRIGPNLLRRTVEWARTTGAVSFLFSMSSHDDPRDPVLMKRFGFRPTGMNYVRELADR